MLSVTGKVAALYAQDLEDGVVLAAVNEVEDLTTGLSRKVWQKLMILYAREPALSSAHEHRRAGLSEPGARNAAGSRLFASPAANAPRAAA
jgi:hypothetical protein